MSDEKFEMYTLDKFARVLDKYNVKKIKVKIESEDGDYYEQFHPGGEVKAIKLEDVSRE